MKWIISIVLALIVVGAIAYFVTKPNYGGSSATPTPTSTTPTVESGQARVSIKNMSFDPATITVQSGTVVTFTNNDSVTHTVTSDTFDSGNLTPGQTYTHTFDQAGTIDYHCNIHPSMKGTITVK